MPRMMPFSTKSKHGWEFEMSLKMPSSLEDKDLIRKRFGTPERMVAEACRNAVIACQGGMRKRKTEEEARAFAENFIDDGRKDVYVERVVIDAEGFTPEQIAKIRASGALVE